MSSARAMGGDHAHRRPGWSRRAKPIRFAVALACTLPSLTGCTGDSDTAIEPSSARESPVPVIRRVDPPAAPGAMAPHLAAGEGGAWLSWLEPTEAGEGEADRMALRVARLDGSTWGEPSTVVSRGDFFANWADVPSVVPARGGSLYAHWLQKSGSATYAYDVRLARSTDGGQTWSPLGLLHDDGTQTEHGFVSLVPEAVGVRAFWLDGRAMADPDAGGPMSLRTALVTDGVEDSVLIDDRVCECCATSATDLSGGPLVVYRDRSDAEIRDISAVRREGPGWGEPEGITRDGWEVPGCPVNGPSIDGRGTEALLAWFTGEGNRPRVQAAFTRDGGRRFGRPLLIDEEGPAGRVSAVLIGKGEGVVGWLGSREGGAVIRLRRIDGDGGQGQALDLASTSAERASGFPTMVRLDDDLLVAWTEPGEPSTLRAALVPLELLPEPGSPAGEEAASGRARRGRPWDRKPGSRAPDLRAALLDGNSWSLQEMAGGAVLLNLWATWCHPCRQEMPVLSDLARDRGAEGLRVVGLSVDAAGAAAALREAVEREQPGYPIVHDLEGGALSTFGVTTLPASFLFDREGILVWSRHGLIHEEDPELDAAIERALAP